MHEIVEYVNTLGLPWQDFLLLLVCIAVILLLVAIMVNATSRTQHVDRGDVALPTSGRRKQRR